MTKKNQPDESTIKLLIAFILAFIPIYKIIYVKKITEGGTGSRHHAKAVGDADYHLPLFSLKVNTLDHEKNSHGLFFL